MEQVDRQECPQPVLYDLDRRDYPSERGDVFRTLQVFRCSVCQALSNRVVMGGYPGYGVRTICPNAHACWHHLLEQRVSRLLPTSSTEINYAHRQEVDDLRVRYGIRRVHDLVGTPDLTSFHWMTNVHAHVYGTFCPHAYMISTTVITEEDLARIEERVAIVRRLGPDPYVEALLETESEWVRKEVRRGFYGNDACALFFPTDVSPASSKEMSGRHSASEQDQGRVRALRLNLAQHPIIRQHALLYR